MNQQQKLEISLFLLRLGVFVVMLVWALDKFVNPGHGAAVFERFYGLGGVGEQALLAIGVVQLVIIVAFVLGIAKTISYGLVTLMHAGSTFSSFQQYLDPFNNLLFFAAWPMLAACVGLFLLRREDRLLAFG